MSKSDHPWFWEIPVSQWLAFYLHHPPAAVWRLWVLVPVRLRDMVSRRVADLPGVCPANAIELAGTQRPDGGFSARSCLRDTVNSGHCWCQKYQSPRDLQADLERGLEDPMNHAEVIFRTSNEQG